MIESNGYLLIDYPVPDLGARDDIGYLCRVHLSDETMITNCNGDKLSFHSLELGDAVPLRFLKAICSEEMRRKEG